MRATVAAPAAIITTGELPGCRLDDLLCDAWMERLHQILTQPGLTAAVASVRRLSNRNNFVSCCTAAK